MLTLFMITCTLIALLLFYFKTCYNFWKKRGIPGPRPHILFGNIKNAALRKENMAITLKNIYDSYPNEPIIGMYRMTTPCLLIRDLDIIKNIMIKDFDKFEDRGVEFSKEGLSANLFHADGETWRVLRSKFSPLFTSRKLKNMTYLINERCDAIMDEFEKITTKQTECDVITYLKRYATSTITVCAFGLEIDIENEELRNTLAKIDVLTLSCNFFHEVDMMFPGLLKKTNISLFPADVTNFFYNMVSDIVKKRKGVPIGRNDFMDLILEMRAQKDITLRKDIYNEDNEKNLKVDITESIIAAQALVFFIAGYETSATILSFLLFELARNPLIQDKIIEEVDMVLEKHNGQITYDSIADAPYLDKVFNEIYRKYPIVPLLRKSNSDYKVPGTNIVIEKDTVVQVTPLGIHHDEKYYPDPENFDPERFSPENVKNRHSCAYLPYGVGPRNCIGIRFGKLQTRLFAFKFFSKYRVGPSEKTNTLKISSTRILYTPESVYVNLIPRKTKKQ